MRILRLFLLVSGVLAIMLALPPPSLADNCGSLGDCYRTLQAAIAAAVGVGLFTVALSVALDAIPGVGTVKGVIEAITGRDLITGEELAWWERALGIVPLGGAMVGAGVGFYKAGKALDRLDDLTDLGRAVDRADDLADAGRAIDRADDAAGAIRHSSDLATSTGGKVIETADDVWAKHPFKRGRDIEQAIDPPGFIKEPSNFPVIDGFSKGTATSVKSLDLGASSYQDLRKVDSTVKGYIDKLAEFDGKTWGGVRIRPGDVKRRVLDLAIPDMPLSDEQIKLLKELQEHATKQVGKHLELTFTVIKQAP